MPTGRTTRTWRSAKALGHRIQMCLEVVLAGIEDRETLASSDVTGPKRDLRLLLQLRRLEAETAESDKAELILAYMLHPRLED